MNGFAALDIHPHRRYVVDIGGRRSSRCRLHINFALFLHSLDFTQNLGLTRAKASAVIYSLVETAGANGLSERGYLHIVLSNLPSMDFRQHPELLKDLMPWSDYMRSCFEQE